jgi:hypothetical protein
LLIQLCLLAAGMYAGRKLVRPQRVPEVQDTEALTQDTEALTQVAAVDVGPSELSRGVATPAEIEADEQVRSALVATGVTMAAVFFPPLRIIGGACVLYAGIPLFQKPRSSSWRRGASGSRCSTRPA